ncbi:FAD-binding PCMH-type domain-containing protein [Fusarium falciforme]|uniref:FAD-binding PCMH-type domain-containing protein n=1 Tax=Fusarium falciforme TaxID=195108 RepID=UPI0023010E45|nr:FAD-binding PCMH-type domain-containing protein [Fusarium falciforme]WAO95526.1 FAD-binding PCMH-type domain-containing protein [Fusarium falciforme]
MRISLASLALLGAGASATATHDSCPCCSALAAVPQLKGKIYVPGSNAYDARLKTYYSANAALEPWYMVLPETTQDVSKIAKVISKKKCPFGIRSGAHSAWKGSNGVENGITIDFSYMNTTTYDSKKKIASIQPGSNWGRVYEALNEYGVAAVGGRASVVGVGGFTTGGGYSFHSNARGFACDVVANFEVVLADGRIVNANKNQHPDLWKVLKDVVDSNKLWGGFVSFDLSQRDHVFESYIDFAENMHLDPVSQLIVSVQYNGKERILISVVSNSDAIPAVPAFDDFLSLPNVSNTLTTGKIADLVPQFTGPTPLGLYANWMTGMTTNDIRVMKFVDEKTCRFQPFTESMVAHSRKAGGNVLGLEDVVADGPALNWLIAVTVDTAGNQKKIAHLTLEYRNAINKYATSIGANKNWEYLNYALGDQNPIKHYGSESVRYLQAASKKYDPQRVFQKLRASGFKIPGRG